MRGVRVGVGGGGAGGGCRLQRSYWHKAVVNKCVLSADLNSGRVRRISEIGRQRFPDRRCKKAERTLSERFGTALWDFEKLLIR